MILVQVLLVAAFVLLVARLLATPNSSQINAWKKILGISFACMAIVAVLFPEVLDWIAHKLGVGRGADLLLYVLAMAFIATQLNNYVRRKQEHGQFVRLVRKLALLEAKINQQD